MNSDIKASKVNSVWFFLSTSWWLDTLKNNRENHPKKCFEQKKNKPGLNLTLGEALIGLRATGPWKEDFLSFKKRPNINLYVECSRILSSLIRPLNFTQNDLCATSDKNTKLQYLEKICYVKSGFEIVYTVEQFSSLFSR